MALGKRHLGLAIVATILVTASASGAGTLAGFGRCLKSKGATFYGASWCPHCRAQREALGDAMDYVRYVECSVDGTQESTPECHKAKIDGYPTWTFADGSRESGEHSLAELAAKTGCTQPRD
jgi:thiol-disulfide isomerase/thioredoxin